MKNAKIKIVIIVRSYLHHTYTFMCKYFPVQKNMLTSYVKVGYVKYKVVQLLEIKHETKCCRHLKLVKTLFITDFPKAFGTLFYVSYVFTSLYQIFSSSNAHVEGSVMILG